MRTAKTLIGLADVQADLSLRLAQSHFVGFVMRRLKYCSQTDAIKPSLVFCDFPA